MLKKIGIIFLVSFLTTSFGCTKSPLNVDSEKSWQVWQVKKANQTNIQATKKVQLLKQRLAQQGVQIAQVGETVSISIPSSLLFKGDSPQFDHAAFYCLDNIFEYLNIYSKTFVEIGGYTNSLMTDADSLAKDKILTSLQAAQVSKYLWNKGLNARMAYSVGYGSSSLISKENIKNRRVEINFQFNTDK